MSQSGAHWTEEETNVLLDIIWDNRHDGELEPAGRCLRFPNDGEIWRHASKALDENTKAQRTPRSCQSKWNTLQQMYGLVQQIRAKFGWDELKGANIGPHNEEKWDAFIGSTKRPKAALVFRDKGWPHLKSVHRLVVTPPHSNASSRTLLAPGGGNNASSPEQPTPTPPLERQPNTQRPAQAQAQAPAQTTSPATARPPPKRRAAAAAADPASDPDARASKRICPPRPHTGATAAPAPAPGPATTSPPLPAQHHPQHQPQHTRPRTVPAPAPVPEPDDFTAILHSALAGTRSLPEPTLRKMLAIRRAERLETGPGSGTGLADVDMARLANVFRADVGAADTYLCLEREGVRRAWVGECVGRTQTQTQARRRSVGSGTGDGYGAGTGTGDGEMEARAGS